jgi:hypothetical protein
MVRFLPWRVGALTPTPFHGKISTMEKKHGNGVRVLVKHLAGLSDVCFSIKKNLSAESVNNKTRFKAFESFAIRK